MTEPKLPPGPWHACLDSQGRTYAFATDDDEQPIRAGLGPWNEVFLDASPEVLCAVCALPLLVEAARGVVERVGTDFTVSIGDTRQMDVVTAGRIETLRAALSLVDGEGRADG
jgi:hypothetical protein